MFHTYARPSRDLRNNYAELSKIVNNRDQVIITNNGREETVLIGIEDFRLYEKFLHQCYIAEELAKAKANAADTNAKWAAHDEVWGEIREKYGLYGK